MTQRASISNRPALRSLAIMLIMMAFTQPLTVDCAHASSGGKTGKPIKSATASTDTTSSDWQKEMALAQELMAAQNIKAAESHYQRALTYVDVKNPKNFAHNLQGYGLTKYYTDDFRSAATLFEKAQESIDQCKTPDIWMVELNSEMLSRAYRHLKQPNKSEIYGLKALNYSAEHMGKESRTYALCLRNIGILRHDQLRYKEADNCFNQCLDILKKTPGTSSDVIADCQSLKDNNLKSLATQNARQSD